MSWGRTNSCPSTPTTLRRGPLRARRSRPPRMASGMGFKAGIWPSKPSGQRPHGVVEVFLLPDSEPGCCLIRGKLLLLASSCLQPVRELLRGHTACVGEAPELLSGPTLHVPPASPESPPVAKHAAYETLTVQPQQGCRRRRWVLSSAALGL